MLFFNNSPVLGSSTEFASVAFLPHDVVRVPFDYFHHSIVECSARASQPQVKVVNQPACLPSLVGHDCRLSSTSPRGTVLHSKATINGRRSLPGVWRYRSHAQISAECIGRGYSSFVARGKWH